MATSFSIQIDITVFKAEQELDATWQSLVEAAKGASYNAYAPYSNYSVGAAILLENGKIIVGNNQENAAYPSGLCAERVAIFHAHANHPNLKVLKIAVIAQPGKGGNFVEVSPCGGCRQVISEFRNHQQHPIEILISGKENQLYLISDVDALLPLKFDKSLLSK